MAGTAAYTQTHYRNGNDDNVDASYSFVNALDTGSTLTVDTGYILRLCIKNTGSGSGSLVSFDWQYRLNGGTWTNMNTSSSVIQIFNSANISDNNNCAQRLGSGTFVSGNKGQTEDGWTTGILSFAAGSETETCCPVTIISGDVSHGDTIDYRCVLHGGTAFGTYTVTGSITVNKPQIVTPGTKALTLTTFAPSVSAPRLVTPSVLSLALTAYAPTVTATNHKIVTPGVASLGLSEFAPTVVASDNKVVTPNVLGLTLSSFIPIITAPNNQWATPGVLGLTLSSFIPTVIVSDHQLVTPGKLALVLTSHIPVIGVSDNQLVTPGTRSLILTIHIPQVAITVQPATGYSLVKTNLSTLDFKLSISSLDVKSLPSTSDLQT